MSTLETLKVALAAGEKFCRRVNNGEIRSKESYNDFCTSNTHLREAIEHEERRAAFKVMAAKSREGMEQGEIAELFNSNSASYNGNAEVTPGQSVRIVRAVEEARPPLSYRQGRLTSNPKIGWEAVSEDVYKNLADWNRRIYTPSAESLVYSTAAITQPMLRAATEYSAKCAANGEIPSGKGYYEAMSAAKETTC